MEKLDSMSVSDLIEYLRQRGVSDNSLFKLMENEVSGQALTYVNDEELKELFPTIGDRALTRRILEEFKQNHKDRSDVSSNNEIDQCEMESYVDEDLSSDIVESSAEDSASDVSGNHPPVSNNTNTAPSITRASIVQIRGYEPALPKPFEVPQNFPRDVIAGLSSKKLVGKMRAKFITTIAQAIYRYKNYPTEDEYLHVAREVTKKWPFLDGGQGTRYIIVALRMRMAYLRKPSDRKRGNPLSRKVLQAQVRMPSIPMSPPSPEVEDNASIKRHCSLLKSEVKKTKPNFSIISKLMEKTYYQRRKEILQGLAVEDALKEYPALKFPDEIVKEFSRIVGDKDIINHISGTWSASIPKILEIANNDTNISLTKFLSSYSQEQVTDDYQLILALGCLVYIVPDVRTRANHESVVTIVEENDDDINAATTGVSTAQPCLLARCGEGKVKDIYLAIEKTIICEVKVEQSILLLFSSFYVFNLHYTASCTNFYHFFEILFLRKKLVGRKPRLANLLEQLL